MDLDWSYARLPDFAGNALKAQDAARTRNNEIGAQNALKNYGTDPAGSTQQLFQYDPRTAIALQDQQQQVAAQNQQQAAVTQQRKRDALTAAGKAVAPVLRGIAPDQRAAKLASLAPQIKQQFGLDDQTIAAAAQGGLDDQTLAMWDGQDPTATTIKETKGADGSSSFVYLPNRAPPAYAQQGAPQAASAPAGAVQDQQAAQGAPAPALPADPSAPRNVRNNNPGNIEDGPFAQSLPGYAGTDGRFAKFNDQGAGQAAQTALLSSYGRKGINTVGGIISRWAPPSDGNNTGSYINFVSRQVGVGPNQPLDMNDPATLTKVASAIQRFEGGPQSVSNGPAPGPAAAQAVPQAAPAPRAPGYVNGVYTVPGDATPKPEWAQDGKGNLVNWKTGERKPDPTASAPVWTSNGKGFLVNKNGDIKPDPSADTATVPPSNVHGPDYLATLPGPQAAQVKALATGRMAFPSGAALKAPYWQEMLQQVANYDPGFDAVNYNARAKARADFTSGKSAQNIKALNTAIGHLGRLDDQIGGTASTGGYPFATDVNKAVNAYQRHAGDSGVTNFEQTASALSTELTAVFRGSGGAEADVKRYLDQLNANASQAQKKDAVKNISALLHSRLEALGDQYQQGMGTTGDKLTLLNPETAQILSRINGATNTAKRPPLTSFQK